MAYDEYRDEEAEMGVPFSSALDDSEDGEDEGEKGSGEPEEEEYE